MGIACFVPVNTASVTMRRDLAKAGIRFVPMGDIDIALVSAVAEEVSFLLGLPVSPAPPLSLEAPAFDSGNNQYSSAQLLKSLRSCGDQKLTVAITDLDLSYPGLNYVFGLADETFPVAVISIARFVRGRDRRPADQQVIGRTVKTAVHELGHLMGLSHCKDRRCVMFFSHNIGDTDFKGKTFCDLCTKTVESKLKGVTSARADHKPG